MPRKSTKKTKKPAKKSGGPRPARKLPVARKTVKKPRKIRTPQAPAVFPVVADAPAPAPAVSQ